MFFGEVEFHDIKSTITHAIQWPQTSQDFIFTNRGLFSTFMARISVTLDSDCYHSEVVYSHGTNTTTVSASRNCLSSWNNTLNNAGHELLPI